MVAASGCQKNRKTGQMTGGARNPHADFGPHRLRETNDRMSTRYAEYVLPGLWVVRGYQTRDPWNNCCNIYLLESEKDGHLMIDSGNAKLNFEPLQMSRSKGGFEKPELVLLTHGHYDHTKGVNEGWNAYLHPADFIDEEFYWRPPGVKPLSTETIKWGEFELEVIHTPGHTPGSVCYLERNYGILFSGDTLSPFQLRGRTDLPGGDIEEMMQSYGQLNRIQVNILCPGHGEIMADYEDTRYYMLMLRAERSYRTLAYRSTREAALQNPNLLE